MYLFYSADLTVSVTTGLKKLAVTPELPSALGELFHKYGGLCPCYSTRCARRNKLLEWCFDGRIVTQALSQLVKINDLVGLN